MKKLLAEQLSTFVNTASFDEGPLGGLIPHRLPIEVREQIGDPFFSLASAEASGTTLRLATRSEVVHLKVSTSTVQVPGFPRAEPTIVVRSGTFEEVLRLDTGVIAFDPATGVLETTSGPVQDLLLHRAPGEEMITVLLPHNSPLEILGLGAEDPMLPAPDGRPLWLHYGSSISHCSDADTPASTWPMQVADALGWNLRNLGLSGQAQLDQAVARFMRDIPADIITVKVGINIVGAGSMRRRVFRSAMHGFLDTIRDGHPTTPLVVIGAITCPSKEQTMGPGSIEGGRFLPPSAGIDPGPDALTLSGSRAILSEVISERAEVDPAIAYLNGMDLFGAPDAHFLPDGLHPNQAGMDLIAERFAAQIPSLIWDLRGGRSRGERSTI